MLLGHSKGPCGDSTVELTSRLEREDIALHPIPKGRAETGRSWTDADGAQSWTFTEWYSAPKWEETEDEIKHQ